MYTINYNNCIHVPDWKWHAYKEGICMVVVSLDCMETQGT